MTWDEVALALKLGVIVLFLGLILRPVIDSLVDEVKKRWKQEDNWEDDYR